MAKNPTNTNGDNQDNQTVTAVTKEQQDTPEKTCGIIMPISDMDGYSAEHWAEVKEILQEVISQTEFTGDLVSNSSDVNIIHDTIVQNIYFNDVVICDVSGKNPNVMFELGLRIAFDKPVIIIKDELTSYSFDTSPIVHLSYPSDLNYRRINQFKNELESKIISTYENAQNGSSYLKSFGRITVAKLETKEVSTENYILDSLKDLKAGMSRLRNELYRRNTIFETGILKESDKLGSSGSTLASITIFTPKISEEVHSLFLTCIKEIFGNSTVESISKENEVRHVINVHKAVLDRHASFYINQVISRGIPILRYELLMRDGKTQKAEVF